MVNSNNVVDLIIRKGLTCKCPSLSKAEKILNDILRIGYSNGYATVFDVVNYLDPYHDYAIGKPEIDKYSWSSSTLKRLHFERDEDGYYCMELPPPKLQPINYIPKEEIVNDLSAMAGIPKGVLYGAVGQTRKDQKEKNYNKEDSNMAFFNIIPSITSVETFNDRCVKVSFADGTFTRSVCSANDNFDIDVGITICLMKRMLSPTSGTKIYNKLIKNIHKGMKIQDKLKEKAIEAEEIRKARIKRIEMKKKARMLKKKEEQIDIVKQGYLRALTVNPDVECEACKID